MTQGATLTLKLNPNPNPNLKLTLTLAREIFDVNTSIDFFDGNSVDLGRPIAHFQGAYQDRKEEVTKEKQRPECAGGINMGKRQGAYLHNLQDNWPLRGQLCGPCMDALGQ